MTLPSLGLTMPQTVEISVVLPAPFGPSSAKISPRRISRFTSLSAEKPDAYVLERLEIVMMFGMAWTIADTARFGMDERGRPNGRCSSQAALPKIRRRA